MRRLKGPARPVIPQADRAALVAALGCVAHVLVFDEDTPHELLRRLRPDVLVKGGTYTPEEVVGREVVEGYGGRVCLTGKLDGLSTTQILGTLRGVPVTPACGTATPRCLPTTMTCPPDGSVAPPEGRPP